MAAREELGCERGNQRNFTQMTPFTFYINIHKKHHERCSITNNAPTGGRLKSDLFMSRTVQFLTFWHKVLNQDSEATAVFNVFVSAPLRTGKRHFLTTTGTELVKDAFSFENAG